jgi:hydrogenase maturation protease
MTKNSFLVIGYGNTLRSDDGVGQIVATEVESWQIPSVESHSLHQLTPEIAETLANSDYAIFIDACPVTEIGETVQIYPIEPIDSHNFSLGHISNPRSLLALTKAIYNYAPEACAIAIPAVNFDLGETLSPIAKNGMNQALQQIQNLIAHH